MMKKMGNKMGNRMMMMNSISSHKISNEMDKNSSENEID